MSNAVTGKNRPHPAFDAGHSMTETKPKPTKKFNDKGPNLDHLVSLVNSKKEVDRLIKEEAGKLQSQNVNIDEVLATLGYTRK